MNPTSRVLGNLVFLSVALAGAGCSNLPGSPPGDLAETTAAPVCDITPALDWMQNQPTIIYTQSPSDEWRDCSGNFLRLSSRIATICPGVHLAAPKGITKFDPNGDNKRPGPAEARSTRGLARWYDEKGAFTPVYYDGTDPLDAPESLKRLRNRIKTGTVLWFSPRVPRAAAGKSALYEEVGGAIDHMGTVIDTESDQAGNVVSWRMYHGQNPRAHNEVTEHYWERSGRSRPVPQGGYGSQRIVGFAESIIPAGTTLN